MNNLNIISCCGDRIKKLSYSFIEGTHVPKTISIIDKLNLIHEQEYVHVGHPEGEHFILISE